MLTARTAKLRNIAATLVGLWLLLTVAWMTPPVQRWMISRILIPVVIRPTQIQGEQAKYVLGDFYIHSKAANYADAHMLLSHDLQKTITVDQLRKQWQKFIAKHGAIRNWHHTASAVQIGFRLKSIRFTHRIVGAKQSSGNATIRLAPEGGTWRIDQLNIRP